MKGNSYHARPTPLANENDYLFHFYYKTLEPCSTDEIWQKKRTLNEFITVQFMVVNSSGGTSETPVPLACNKQC